MRLLLFVTGGIVILLQFQLWLGEDGYFALKSRQADAAEQLEIIAELRQSNRELEVEALDLKNGKEAIEERARSELGMIKEGETFYIIVD